MSLGHMDVNGNFREIGARTQPFLHQAKTFGALDSLKQFEPQLLLGGVLRQVQQVETCVSHWKEVHVSSLLDRDFYTSHPSNGNSITAS